MRTRKMASIAAALSSAPAKLLLLGLLDFPLKCTPRLNAHFPLNHPLSLNTHKIVNEDDIKKALAEIESSKAPDYAIIARKYGLTRSTLSRRARGKTTSRAEF